MTRIDTETITKWRGDPATAMENIDHLLDAAVQLVECRKELNRRKGDPITRLHNICEGIREEADASAFSQEEWDRIDKENLRLKNWVKDLQSGLYINCVYCGHRYGPNTEVPASMADVLKEHIEKCPQHPLCAALEREEVLCDLLQRGVQLRGKNEFRVADWVDDVNRLLNARKCRKEKDAQDLLRAKEVHEEES